MDRISDVTVEITNRALALAGDHIDMVFFYDDVASQDSLLISKGMWHRHIRPYHARIVEVVRAHGKKVMYHCDGAVRQLNPDPIDLGMNPLNLIQVSTRGMAPAELKREYGSRLSFHGGIDIVQTLPEGSLEDIGREVVERVKMLGGGGVYGLAGPPYSGEDTTGKHPGHVQRCPADSRRTWERPAA